MLLAGPRSRWALLKSGPHGSRICRLQFSARVMDDKSPLVITIIGSQGVSSRWQGAINKICCLGKVAITSALWHGGFNVQWRPLLKPSQGTLLLMERGEKGSPTLG